MSDDEMVACGRCGGSGYILVDIPGIVSDISSQAFCPRCSGLGMVKSDLPGPVGQLEQRREDNLANKIQGEVTWKGDWRVGLGYLFRELDVVTPVGTFACVALFLGFVGSSLSLYNVCEIVTRAIEGDYYNFSEKLAKNQVVWFQTSGVGVEVRRRVL